MEKWCAIALLDPEDVVVADDVPQGVVEVVDEALGDGVVEAVGVSDTVAGRAMCQGRLLHPLDDPQNIILARFTWVTRLLLRLLRLRWLSSVPSVMWTWATTTSLMNSLYSREKFTARTKTSASLPLPGAPTTGP
jgi:hypothetical protein